MHTPPRALVVVESHFGNTLAIADAVAAALRAAGTPTVVSMAHEAALTIPPDTTIVVLAAPTHDADLSTLATRKRAAGLGAKDYTDAFGLREWIARCTGGRAARLVCLGTAEKTGATPGQQDAAAAAAALASRHGFEHVMHGPTFSVDGPAGPLAPGELQRARQWACVLGAELSGGDRTVGSAACPADDGRPQVASGSVGESTRGVPAGAGAAGDAASAGELHGRSAVELARLVATGQRSARELVQEAIDRIEARADLNVIAYERFEAALAEADRPPSGPFAGVPLLLKDLGCDVAGVGTSMGSAVVKQAGLVASEDAELVRRVKAAGFIILGRTTSPEFGISSSTESVAFGTTRNPWGRELSAGGSSGGSAAAVAGGLVPLAQGSDGAGSLRMPAALCGVAALKPTHGRISQAPDWEVMMGHNDNGAIARHIVDLAGFLDIAEGGVPGDPAAHRCDGPGSHVAALQAPPGPRLRIGLFLNDRVGDVPIEPAVREAVVTVGNLLAGAGHTVEEAWPDAYDDPDLLDRFIDAIAPSLVDLVASLGEVLGRPVEPTSDLEPVSRYWHERGSRRTAGDLAGDLRWLGGYRRRLIRWWSEGWDLLVAPSFPTATRPLGLEEDGGEQTRRHIDFVRTTVPFNTSGQPAVTLPAMITDTGPVGVQLVGAPGQDRLVLLAASELAGLTGSPHWYPPAH